jgi:hypothetical protein
MNEKEIETLRVETKKLLDKFSKALDSVKNSEEWNVEREEDRRKEGSGTEADKDFRKIMLENAPNKNEDFILAEKKSW